MSGNSQPRLHSMLSEVSRIPWPRAGRGVWKRSDETQWSGVAPNIQLPVVLVQKFAVENDTLMFPVLAQVKSRLSVCRKTVRLVLENHNREASPVGLSHKLMASHDSVVNESCSSCE